MRPAFNQLTLFQSAGSNLQSQYAVLPVVSERARRLALLGWFTQKPAQSDPRPAMDDDDDDDDDAEQF